MLSRQSITIDGFTVSYIEQNAAAEKTIFFFHGNSNSADLWQYQLSSPAFCEYRLIAFDLPAHGRTAAPSDLKNCNLVWFGEIFSQAVIALSKERPYLLCGLSLGRNVVAEMLGYGISPSGIFLIGSNFLGKEATPANILSDPLVTDVLFTNDASLEDIERYFQRATLVDSQADRDALLKDYLQVDPAFREAFPTSISNGCFSDEIMLLTQFQKPIKVVFGAQDNILSSALLLPLVPYLSGNKVFMIAVAAHLVPLDQPDELNKLLVEFWEEVIDSLPSAQPLPGQ